MPLRLLERVMPWLAAKLPEPDIEEMLATVRQHQAKLLHACLPATLAPHYDESLMPAASVGMRHAPFQHATWSSMTFPCAGACCGASGGCCPGRAPGAVGCARPWPYSHIARAGEHAW